MQRRAIISSDAVYTIKTQNEHQPYAGPGRAAWRRLWRWCCDSGPASAVCRCPAISHPRDIVTQQ